MAKNNTQKIVIAFVAVIHEGYKRFFTKHKDAQKIFILGSELIAEFPYLAKDIRQLEPKEIQKALAGLGIKVDILDQKKLQKLNEQKFSAIIPNEDVMKSLWEKYFPKQEVTLDSIFLRWDKHNAALEKPVIPENRITRDEFHKKVLREAEARSKNSSDIWRHVGAALVKNKEVIMVTHNKAMPSEHTPYVYGDPRNAFHKGVHVEFSLFIHAEAQIIAEAARKGISLQGSDMYVTVFPCPPCAKLIAHAGIKTLYCGGGYGVLDGEEVLKAKGVKIIFVE